MSLFKNIIGFATQARTERQAARWLASLHSDRCDEHERARFRTWLNADARHAAAFEELTSAWELVGAAHHSAAPIPVMVSRRKLLLTGGAALTAAAGGFVAVSAGAEDYETGVGERRSIILADRSKVLLDADSHLRVRTRDDGCDATLKRGRAHFDLGARASGALTVHAGNCNLRIDRGSFAVETEDGRAGRIIMLSGSAQLQVGEGSGQSAMTLDTAHMFEESSTKIAPVADATVERFTAWRNGRAIFSNDSIAQAVATMNRYDRQRLRVEDQRIADLRISGTFRLGDNAAFADALRAMLPVDVAVEDGSLLLKGRTGHAQS